MKRLVCVSTLMIIALVSGCSSQLGYRFADTLLEWKIDDYVSLSDPLDADVSEAIDELHGWHARQELPRYKTALLQLRELVEQTEINADEVATMRAIGWQFWDTIRLEVKPYALEFLPRLSDAQVDELIANLQTELDERIERREERRSERAALSESERFDDQVDRSVDNLREWLGPITASQRQLLRDFAAQDRPDGDLWTDYRQAWLDEFAKVLRSDRQHPEYRERLTLLIEQPDDWRSAELQQHLAQSSDQQTQLVIALHGSLTTAQKQHLVMRIDGYVGYIDALVKHFNELQ